jgi:2-polyprenyl-3-methyl-5-hydroxy-6-metoxy-1,4-benzoquinol methylase
VSRTTGPRESAPADDVEYLLREIDTTPFRFRLAARRPAIADPVEAAVADYVGRHPGATTNAILAEVPAVHGHPYAEARALVVRLVDRGILTLAGRAPLEEVDGRYERVPACEVCGAPSADHPTLFWKYSTPVVRCRACGLVYANPRWKAEHLFGRYGDPAYWQHYADTVRPTLDPTANRARWAPYLDGLEPARRDGRLLDVGCATGEFLAAARARGWEPHGVDISPVAAARAAELTGAPVHVGTLATVPYPPGSFDAVTLWDVIEHSQRPRADVTAVARLLRPGGRLGMTTPNVGSLTYRLLGRKWSVVGPNEHIYYFSPATLGRLLAGCGFEVVATRTEGLEVETRASASAPGALRPLVRRLAAPLGRIALRRSLGDGLHVIAVRTTAS